MQTIFSQFSQVLGTTLLHSLWQGLVIYALLRIVLLCTPSANNKYNMALLALAASVLWPLITLAIEISRHPFITQTGASDDMVPFTYIPIVHAYSVEASNTISFAIDNYLPYMVVLWFIGIVLNSARLLWGWRNIYIIKQTVIDTPVLQSSIQKLSHILKISKRVQVFMSDHVDVPCIVGYLKPMIILPMGIVSQFSADQIQSILIHEMAHIRRNDYFINLLQQVVTILFFFNPFTHLINKIIYNEREHCCDDLVLQTSGQPLIYAQTLLLLEEARTSADHQLALAATGKQHYLLNRIKRIMETKKQVSNIRHIVAAVLLLLGSMGTIAWLNPEIKDGKVSITPVKQIPFTLPDDNDTTRKVSAKALKTVTAKKKTILAKTGIATAKTTTVVTKGRYQLGYNNPTLDKLSADVEKYSAAMNKYYDSPEYHALEKEMELKSHAVDSFYNRPEIKKMQAELEAKSVAFSKVGESPELKDLQQKMEKLSEAQSAYFESAAYKKLQKDFEEQGKWFEKENASKSPEFKKRSEELEKAGDALRAYSKDPQHKADMEQLKTYGKQMREYYASGEYKQKAEDYRKLSEEMRKAYQNPEIKQQQEQLRTLSKQMREYTNKPEIKKQKELLKQASAKMREYTNSPAFKKLREEMMKNNRAMYSSDRTQADTAYKVGK